MTPDKPVGEQEQAINVWAIPPSQWDAIAVEVDRLRAAGLLGAPSVSERQHQAIHTKFKRRTEDDTCDCPYCRGDAEELAELAADYEMQLHTLQQQLASAREDQEHAEKRTACPCKLVTPCHPKCTCVSPHSSRGCRRCCSYGSLEQRHQMAEFLVSAPEQANHVGRAQAIAQVKALLLVESPSYHHVLFPKLDALQPDSTLACLPLDAREQVIEKLRLAAECDDYAEDATTESSMASFEHDAAELRAEARRLLQLPTERT